MEQASLNRLYPLERQNLEAHGKKVKPWVSLIEEFLRRNSKDAGTHSASGNSSGITRRSFAETIDLANHLSTARTELNRDLLAHIGFKLNNWSTVYGTLSRLVDAAEAVWEASASPPGVIEDRAKCSKLSLDELTDEDSSPQSRRTSKITGLASLDSLTYRPFARDYHMLLMAEVWKSLGIIILYAVDTSPAKSKLAMSVVYRTLARLHHSGLVSERVYKYTTPGIYQATFRPPGMHLLSSHIMDVLSDAAWTVHEAEVAAEAAAAGKDAPFLPAKINIKELGHEIWLEFILWCCVEHGHINEGIWLVDKLVSRQRKGWKFQSWAPLLRDEQSLRNTRISREVSTWPSPDSASVSPEPQKRTDSPSLFHGLGKQTISVEVVQALLDNLLNLVHMGMSTGGTPATELLRRIDNLKFTITSATASDSKFLPTIRAANWFTTRVMESGGLIPEADPQTFDDFLKLTPHVVPPWSNGMCPVEEEALAKLHRSQLYDDTSAFTGLMEYNLKFHSFQRFTGSALNLFAHLQAVMDTCKMRRLDDFFSSQVGSDSAHPSSHSDDIAPFESSIPQLSNVTLAHLFDLITVSRAYAFGEWLLLSGDIDGPTVPASAYGDQALAPSLLRFAAATKNDTVGESVVQSLAEPISLNTLRALLNYRITMHQWDRVVPTLRYIRDNRIKTWAHSNIAAIAAEIIRLEHALRLQPQVQNPDDTVISDIEVNLVEAKKVLYRILFGEFDENPWRKRRNPNFQAHTLISFTRLFRHLPSPSLHEIADSVFESEYVPMYRLPYIPSPPFHTVLAAIVETQGPSAAMKIYKRFCVSYSSPEFSHLVVGGITRFYQKAERDFRRGDPDFDAAYFHHLQKKMVFPNPNTVRILTQAAVREYQAAVAEIEAEAEARPESNPESAPASPESSLESTVPEQSSGEPLSLPTDDEIDPLSSQSSSPLTPAERKAEAERTLIFCIRRFEIFHMSDIEIAREVGEELYSNYKITNKDRREWDRRMKSESKRKWEKLQELQGRLKVTGDTHQDIKNNASINRKERRVIWQKMRKLREKLKEKERARNDTKLHVLLDMATRERERKPDHEPVPMTKSEMRRHRRQKGIEKRKAREKDEESRP
ncbi:uncharacterized protein DSM5745_03055 [Aspergillus mulundensis]|uniref:Uncharacterized protein n=1 Tax=Aspergillus mulundensis TaxID=1810919 RepID=A0A3D8SJC8_9EURO|nr:hypothetical protein DSM5745_03055 [Aspergillus mulundensis]RDW86413.1 hypothetical protein DSM5745_03055 [Aspergillus mulundensis]